MIVEAGQSLIFSSWEQTENGNKPAPLSFDTRKVYISTDYGLTWTQIYEAAGNENIWYQAAINLQPYANPGSIALFKFVFNTVDKNNNKFQGWFVDDVRLDIAPTATVTSTVTETSTTTTTPTPVITISLADALDNNSITWTTGGDVNWYGETGTMYYGIGAAQSGNIGGNQSSYLQGTFTGPVVVRYYWKVAVQPYGGFLSVVDWNNQTLDSITGNVDWKMDEVYVPAGTHTLTWKYYTNALMYPFANSGWVDKVELLNPTPVPTIILGAGNNWTQATASADFSGRAGSSSVVFNNKMWVIAGSGIDSEQNPTYYNDVWSSIDGISWTQVTSNAGFSTRYAQESVIFNNEIWVIGGTSEDGTFNSDIYNSPDGQTWTNVVQNAPFGAREGFKCVVFDDGDGQGPRIWLIGGFNQNLNTLCNDIWQSDSTGTSWTLVTNNAKFSPRAFFGCVVYNNKMYVIGGLSAQGNDVWCSSDGVNWNEVDNQNKNFPPRYAFTTLVYNNTMWLIGGAWEGDGNCYNDVWNSGNGADWTEISSNANFSSRYVHSSVVYNNKMWVIGGTDCNNNEFNDVWYSPPNATATFTPSAEI
jgi:hypothetical protein